MAEVIDGKTGKPDPTPPDYDASNLPLSSAADVRREQARVYREARSGRLDEAKAAKFVWMLGEIRKSIETEEIERRLSELENRQLPGNAPALPAARH